MQLPPAPKFRPRRGETATLVSLTGNSEVGASLKQIIDAHVRSLTGKRQPTRAPEPASQPKAARQATRPPEHAANPAPPAGPPPSVTVRTTLSIADDPKRNTTAAADDGTRVKWGKPNTADRT